ncbi:putative scramblase [Helianthus annuus]|nr:putative scramblase [Helianthus annuus]
MICTWVVENPGFWYWTFTLKDVNGEVFTDAGQYVIRFGSTAATKGISELSKKVQEFEVAHPLTLSERAVTVALAISLDNDNFSRHGGW